jgi:hypothetical protein
MLLSNWRQSARGETDATIPPLRRTSRGTHPTIHRSVVYPTKQIEDWCGTDVGAIYELYRLMTKNEAGKEVGCFDDDDCTHHRTFRTNTTK